MVVWEWLPPLNWFHQFILRDEQLGVVGPTLSNKTNSLQFLSLSFHSLIISLLIYSFRYFNHSPFIQSKSLFKFPFTILLNRFTLSLIQLKTILELLICELPSQVYSFTCNIEMRVSGSEFSCCLLSLVWWGALRLPFHSLWEWNKLNNSS